MQVRQEPSPLLTVQAFGEVQAGIAGRVDQPPVAEDLSEVGSYRFFGHHNLPLGPVAVPLDLLISASFAHGSPRGLR